MTQLFDRQDPTSPISGRIINNSAELRSALASVRERAPFFAELIGENGFKLLLGLGGDKGCAQFSSVAGSAPYWMAVACRGDEPSEEKLQSPDREPQMTYLIGDTPTPVPRRYCLPFESIMNIAEAFVQTGGRTPEVSWEEI